VSNFIGGIRFFAACNKAARIFFMSKIPSISLIFDRDENGNYTSKAPLYQDIIRYSLVQDEKGQDGIKIWDLTSWLLNHNKEFVNSRKEISNRNTSKSNLIDDKIGTVRRYVAALCLLDIISGVGESKQMKGQGPVKIYAFTFSGFLLAWIMESMDPAKRNYCENQIYDLWQSKVEHDNSPVDIFTSNIFKKYKEKGVFGNFVVDRIGEFLASSSHIETMNDVIESISVLRTKMGKAELFIELWQQTWNELNNPTRQKLLYHFKSDIELRMSKQAYSPEDYEEHRMALRNELEVLALEAFCRNCGAYNYAVVQLVPYLRRRKIPQSGLKTVVCAECKTQNVEIPNL
jgi:hypothetical protein